MTVIAFRDGIVAADSLSVGSDNSRRSGLVNKLTRGPKGEVLAVLGSSIEAQALQRWYMAGKAAGEQPPGQDGVLLVFWPDRIERYFNEMWEVLSRAPFQAYGIGGCIAVGAMEMGATAEEAVWATIKHNVYCGEPVIWLRVGADG